MEKYRLERIMQYTARTEIEVASWDEAIKMLKNSDTDFDRMEDDILIDSSAEYLGDVKEQAKSNCQVGGKAREVGDETRNHNISFLFWRGVILATLREKEVSYEKINTNHHCNYTFSWMRFV